MANDQDKYLLVFGGGMLQMSLIRTAKRLGYRVVVIDPDRFAVGRNSADIFIVVAGNDFDTTLRIAHQYRVSGLVTAATDKPLIMMARVARVLNLPFPSEEAVRRTINKNALKEVLQANDLPCAKGFFCSPSQICDMLGDYKMTFPLIIKPVDSSGSRGVLWCSNAEELHKVTEEALQYSSSDNILVEEFMEGPEISVECLIQRGKVNIIQITDKTITRLPYSVELGHEQPSRFKEEYLPEIQRILSAAVNALGLDDCALHPEFKITKDGPKIVEIGPRLGGDFITSHLVPISTGINMEEQLINIATSHAGDFSPKKEQCSGVIFFDFSSTSSTPKDMLKILEGWKSQIVEYEFYQADCNRYLPITNSMDRHGHVIFKAETREHLVELKELFLMGCKCR